MKILCRLFKRYRFCWFSGLPKLNLPKFDGNILKWQEFWDVYKSAVHEQELSEVTKFNYLKGLVRGAAATVISGISVTNDN